MYNTENRKKFHIFNIIILSTILLSLALIPPISHAMRRNHRYHSDRTTNTLGVKTTPTVTPFTPSARTASQSSQLTGQWAYVPGTYLDEKGLHIQDAQIMIVSQDARETISNPPINLAGSYLKDVTGDFAIEMDMMIPAKTTATFQLYSQPPIIADEFRVERPSMQFTILDGVLKVRSISSSTQRTTADKTFTLPTIDALHFVITRQGTNFLLQANDQEIGTVAVGSLLTNKTLWFGVDSLNGEWTLTGFEVTSPKPNTFQFLDTSALRLNTHNPEGLQALATKKRPGFLIGTAVALGPLLSDPAYTTIALDNNMFGSYTPENDMKMINLQPQRHLYTFQKADALIALAQQNGIKDIHGHTLVFGEANPAWFNALPVKTTQDKQAIEAIMLDHIKTVVTHFGDAVQSWDVVNEPIADYDEFEQGSIMRNHKWYQAMGNAYIIKAFEAAHKANPKAILSINEYGLEEDGERWDAFMNLMTQLKKDLQARNIPTNLISVGFQAHVYESGDRINTTVLRQHIKELAALGFKSQISENDVYSDDGVSIQTQQYSEILKACVEEPTCIAWRGWMLTDKYDVFKDDDGSIQYGEDGLFTSTLQPRPAVKAMQDVLN